MTTALTFQSTTFDVIDRNGQPWVRGPQIAGALGFSRPDRISDIYARHSDEFTDAMTAVVTLPTEGGPQEAALMTLWGEWFWREGDIKRAFDALEKELDARASDLIHHAISDLGRNADTCFSTDAMIEGLRCARTSARRNFDEAMSCLRTHLRMSCNMAVMLGR